MPPGQPCRAGEIAGHSVTIPAAWRHACRQVLALHVGHSHACVPATGSLMHCCVYLHRCVASAALTSAAMPNGSPSSVGCAVEVASSQVPRSHEPAMAGSGKSVLSGCGGAAGPLPPPTATELARAAGRHRGCCMSLHTSCARQGSRRPAPRARQRVCLYTCRLLLVSRGAAFVSFCVTSTLQLQRLRLQRLAAGSPGAGLLGLGFHGAANRPQRCGRGTVNVLDGTKRLRRPPNQPLPWVHFFRAERPRPLG